jgi:hypothetical protein
MMICGRGANEVPNEVAEAVRGGCVRVPLSDTFLLRLISGEPWVTDANRLIEELRQ